MKIACETILNIQNNVRKSEEVNHNRFLPQ